MMKQIMIVGAAPRYEALPKIINAEIWTIPTGLPLHRVTRVFELHDYMSDVHTKRINEANPEITYMQHKFEPIPSSRKFHIEQLVHRFGEHFNNTISYMLGLAIMLYECGDAPMVLYLRRMHTIYSKEYQQQVPEICYYVGLARGLGVDVRISQHSIILKPKRLYMYKDYEYGSN